jgi:hypothetical protein
VSRGSQKAVQSLQELSCAKSCTPIGAASNGQYQLEDSLRIRAMLPRVALRHALPLLAEGDESAMNFEGLGGSFCTYLLVTAAFFVSSYVFHS